jgi:hypothetical protein
MELVMPRYLLVLSVLALLLLLGSETSSFAREHSGADQAFTELAQVARLFPRHRGPTMIYVNFDGWKNYDGKGHHILPYRADDGTRGRDIQLTLFRTAEIFAPFEVQVRRLRGNGKRDERNRGNTTVFVGGNTSNVDQGKKYGYASTPFRYTDSPGEVRGVWHRPNSDPFDIAFVDPVGQGDGGGWVNRRDVAAIARGIAHEAGHTFGLAHTETKPAPEIMSYDAPNVYFANRSFRITDLNYTGTKLVHDPKNQLPRWGQQTLVTQNSFAYLRAVLGARPADDHASVADRRAVDPGFRDGPPGELRPGSPLAGAIEYRGDYDVFVLRPESAGERAVRVSPASGSRLAPVLFVFDASGRNLLGFANGKARPGRVAEVGVRVAAGQSYKVVVGAADCATAGAYQVTASRAAREEAAAE